METTEPKKIEILKRKASFLFDKDDRTIIFDAVNRCHDIVTRTTLLIKIFYLENIERELAIDSNMIDLCFKIVDGKQHLQIRSTKKEKSNKKINVKVDKKIVTITNGVRVEKIVKVIVQKTVKEIEDEKKVMLFRDLLECYNKHFIPLPPSDLSLSYILEYSNIQLQTAYNNNIEINYEKYVKKYVNYYLANRENYKSVKGVPKAIRLAAWNCTQHLLFNKDINENNEYEFADDEIELLREELCIGRNYKLEDHIPNNRSKYLAKMVYINQEIEHDFNNMEGIKLYSPLILSTTFVPSFIRIDTTALAQLLMDQSRVEEFKRFYKLEYNTVLNITNKGDICKSYKSLTGKENVSDLENLQHATRIWKFLTNIEGRREGFQHVKKQFKGILEQNRNGIVWIFDNMILTDGYVVNFQVTPKEGAKRRIHGEKKIKKTSGEKQEIRRTEFPSCDNLQNYVHSYYNDEVILLGVDPGKGCLIKVSDGHKDGVIQYTQTERNKLTLKKNRKKQSDVLRSDRKHVINFEGINYPIDKFETMIMSRASKKSCNIETFVEYLKYRNIGQEEMKKLYNRPLFRQHKFLVYSKTKSADVKAIQKIKTFYDTRYPDQKKLMMYGNWGRCPNIKNSAPTPGIGLRRKVHKVFETITTPEHFTSQTCPCCQTRTLEHPNVQNLQKNKTYHKHHLLRCTNVDCKRFWNRDIAGALNILEKGHLAFNALLINLSS